MIHVNEANFLAGLLKSVTADRVLDLFKDVMCSTTAFSFGFAICDQSWELLDFDVRECLARARFHLEECARLSHKVDLVLLDRLRRQVDKREEELWNWSNQPPVFRAGKYVYDQQEILARLNATTMAKITLIWSDNYQQVLTKFRDLYSGRNNEYCFSVHKSMILADLFGNPYRFWRHDLEYDERHAGKLTGRVFNYPMEWLFWNRMAIPALAGEIYQRGKFGDLGILADMLEDAGCVHEEILWHCRGQQRCEKCLGQCGWLWSTPGVCFVWEECDHCGGKGFTVTNHKHWRGCWAVNLLRGFWRNL